MIGAGFTVGAAATRKRGGAHARPDIEVPAPSQPWPEGAVALWLILGQSNADGYAPWRQDPARANPAAAVAALTPAERTTHPWLRVTAQATDGTQGRFRAEGASIATDAAPRTSTKTWTNAVDLGIPAPTSCFGPEIGLLRHVLGGAAPESWRDDAAPRLYIFKQTNGGSSVDHFRWGGAGQDRVLGALRQSGGLNLQGLAAAGPVLLQGVIFVIGEKDANDQLPGGGGTMADTLEPRFRDWVRQVRAALGCEAPVAFVEIHDAVDVSKRAANAAIASLAASLPNAAVIERQPDWTNIGDNVHYDAQGQDRLGAAAFAHLRAVYGRAGDGLATAFPFTGLKPWFHVPPVFIDDRGGQMRLAAVAATSGVIHARVTEQGAPAPSAAEIRDGSGLAGGFAKNVTADAEVEWFSPPGSFTPNLTQDCHFALEGADGTLGETFTARRGGNVKFIDALTLASNAGGTASFTLKPSFAGTLNWTLHVGSRGWMRAEDVDAMAFLPAQAGQAACTGGAVSTLTVAGLTPGTTCTMFATGRRSSDGLGSVTQKVVFTVA